jgi:hypothetical protein
MVLADPRFLQSIEKSKASSNGTALCPHRYCPNVFLRTRDNIFGGAASDACSLLDQVNKID